jgi:F420-non-reducing hydrogenase iron-sulfur subunit
MIMGCLEGNCHFVNGNFRARARVQRVYTILEKINIGGGRIRMFNLSAGEGAKFAAYANEFVDQIQELGPSPINVARKKEAQIVPTGGITA